MSALNDATIRYHDAGLCNESQRRILAATLLEGEASIATLDHAVAVRAPITLAQYEASLDPDVSINDRTRYGIAFGGLDPRINDFAMRRDELEEVIARALARGAPMTEAEIAHLARNVVPGRLY